MTPKHSFPWPHHDIERQHLIHDLKRIGFADIIHIDGEIRYRLTPYQLEVTSIDDDVDITPATATRKPVTT